MLSTLISALLIGLPGGLTSSTGSQAQAGPPPCRVVEMIGGARVEASASELFDDNEYSDGATLWRVRSSSEERLFPAVDEPFDLGANYSVEHRTSPHGQPETDVRMLTLILIDRRTQQPLLGADDIREIEILRRGVHLGRIENPNMQLLAYGFLRWRGQGDLPVTGDAALVRSIGTDLHGGGEIEFRFKRRTGPTLIIPVRFPGRRSAVASVAQRVESNACRMARRGID